MRSIVPIMVASLMLREHGTALLFLRRPQKWNNPETPNCFGR
jgi:hypothetical protein